MIIYLFSQYTKHVIILTCIAIYLTYFFIAYVIKRSLIVNYSNKEFVRFVLLVFSLPTWLLGWLSVGGFMSGARALPLIQFLFTANIVQLLHERSVLQLQKGVRLSVVAVLLVILSFLGFASNYMIHIGPNITSPEGDFYTYSVWTQGVISPPVLEALSFLNSLLDKNYALRFMCVQPYIGFGLCDLLWDKPKIPSFGFVSPEFTSSETMIELLSGYTNVIVPMPANDKVIPGRLGYVSLYKRPFFYLILRGGDVIYSNSYYMFITS